VQIRLATPDTFGAIRWNRAERWRNQTPYPLRLRYIHALVSAPQGPVVYSWDLGNTEVPPMARVAWDAARIPAWVDAQAKRIWVDYTVADDCAACDRQVIEKITEGVSSVSASQIRIRTITPLADTGAYAISIQIRSRHFDPQAAQVQVKPDVLLDADGKDFTVGPIYLGSRQDGESVPGDPLYEYFVSLIMKDGTTYKATHWVPSDSLRLLIGKVQVEQALGMLPAKDGAR
jgi:hypothetical protein